MNVRVKSVRPCLAMALFGLAVCGCGTDYRWRSSVPEELRTITVPTFRNESDVPELGAVATRQILREIQREGTFKIRPGGEAALEVQGTVKSAVGALNAYNRRSGARVAAYRLEVKAVVSVIDKRRHAVLVDNRTYTASDDFTSGTDVTTATRDASGRVADDLARQVVDDLLKLKK